MLNLAVRHRMKKIIKQLENKKDISPLLNNHKYLKAFQALESGSYITAFYADREDYPYHVIMGKKGAVYLLERCEIWGNRILGFICGVLTSVFSGILLNLL